MISGCRSAPSARRRRWRSWPNTRPAPPPPGSISWATTSPPSPTPTSRCSARRSRAPAASIRRSSRTTCEPILPHRRRRHQLRRERRMGEAARAGGAVPGRRRPRPRAVQGPEKRGDPVAGGREVGDGAGAVRGCAALRRATFHDCLVHVQGLHCIFPGHARECGYPRLPWSPVKSWIPAFAVMTAVGWPGCFMVVW